MSSHDKYDDNDDDIDYDDSDDNDDDEDEDVDDDGYTAAAAAADDDDDDVEFLLLHCYVQTLKTKIPNHESNLEYCSLRFHLIGHTMYEMNLSIDQKLELVTMYNITSSATGKFYWRGFI